MRQVQLISAILKNINEGVFALDEGLRIIYVNPSAVRMCGSPEKNILGKSALQILRLLEPKNLTSFFHTTPAPGSPRHFKDAIFKVEGNTLVVDGSITTLCDACAGIQGYVIIARDVSDMKKLQASLSYQASHDKLTGLLNREGFVMELDTIVDLVKRNGGSPSLMQINIDGFKQVTDVSGVAGGNAVLIQFAGMLKSVIRENDIPARLANDIFALICMENDPSYSYTLAERIHETVRKTVFSNYHETFSLTASIGMIQITEKAAFGEALLSTVDIACNSARCTGGDKTLSA
jgi:diguanylate cyclase (GGDEF)-like protein/PAS domain S-box-containing protein